MKKLIKIIILILLSTKVNANPFTILAKSGLNVRKEPNTKSDKISLLPFGTVVEAEVNYESDVKYTRVYNQYSEVIEGKHGFWIRISYGNIKGYIFSGFGLIGEWVVNSTEINKEYRLLRPGRYCDAINFDPKLNWYALLKSNGKLSVKKTEVTLRLVHEFNEQDTLGENNEFWMEYPLIVQSNQKDTVLFLIGSKNSLEEGSILSQFGANQWGGYSGDERFLFPEQFYEFYYKEKKYQSRAFEGVKLTNTNKEGYLKKYQIELSITAQNETKKYNISKELDLDSPAEIHCNYKTPQLILVGDINKDDLLDFIYYSFTMADSCGICWEHHLFLSDKSKPNRLIRKVANEIRCSCTM
jgi:Bacterial SH3 domain